MPASLTKRATPAVPRSKAKPTASCLPDRPPAPPPTSTTVVTCPSATAGTGSIPPQVSVQHASGDEAQLDLGCALHDGELARVAVPELGWVVLHVAGGAQELQRHSRGAHRQLGGGVLGHGELGCHLIFEIASV